MKKFSIKDGFFSYWIYGEGNPIFLLIHNAGGNHQMMNATAEYFSKKGTVITLDLLGHGTSSAPGIDYTVERLAEGIIQLCKHEKLQKVVVVGLNYGANVGMVMIEKAPILVSHLVLIEPPIFMEPWIIQVVEQQIEDLETSKALNYQELVESLLVKTSAKERELALFAFKSTESFVKASVYKQLLLWDQSHTHKYALPSLLIQTSQPFCSEEKLSKLFSNLKIGRVVDSGPWATLEVPAQVHAMIDRFLESYTTSF